jgi:hypothetical protein
VSELKQWNGADIVGVEEEWIKHEGVVYRRWCFIGHAWGDWESQPNEDIPWTVMRRLDELAARDTSRES